MKHFPSYLVLVAVIGIGISMYRHPPNGDSAEGVVWRKVAVDARTSTVSQAAAVPPKDCARIKIDGDIFSTEACHDPRPHMVSLAGRIQEARTQDIALWPSVAQGTVQLAAPLSKTETAARVNRLDGRRKPPYGLRLEREIVIVTAAKHLPDGITEATIQRHVYGTTATSHAAGIVVEVEVPPTDPTDHP